MPTPPTQPRIHLAYIDGLRAVCALWVLLYHAVGKTPLPKVLRWINWGHFAVPAFIVISGFCLMLPVTRKNGELGSALTFYQRRARRILPPYYLALFLFVLMQGVTDWRDIGLHVLLLHNLTPTTFYGINGSFWSIAVEWQIYWLFPAIVWGWGKLGAKTVVLTALSAAYALNFALAQTSLWGLCVHYVGLFTIGAGAAWIAFHPSLQTTRLQSPLAALRHHDRCSAVAAGRALWASTARPQKRCRFSEWRADQFVQSAGRAGGRLCLDCGAKSREGYSRFVIAASPRLDWHLLLQPLSAASATFV